METSKRLYFQSHIREKKPANYVPAQSARLYTNTIY